MKRRKRSRKYIPNSSSLAPVLALRGGSNQSAEHLAIRLPVTCPMAFPVISIGIGTSRRTSAGHWTKENAVEGRVSAMRDMNATDEKSLRSPVGRRFRDQAALRTGPGNLCSRTHGPDARRRVHRCPAASSAAKASTPWGDQLIPWSLQRADIAQSLYFSTRVLAIHNPARCRCW